MHDTVHRLRFGVLLLLHLACCGWVSCVSPNCPPGQYCITSELVLIVRKGAFLPFYTHGGEFYDRHFLDLSEVSAEEFYQHWFAGAYWRPLSDLGQFADKHIRGGATDPLRIMYVDASSSDVEQFEATLDNRDVFTLSIQVLEANEEHDRLLREHLPPMNLGSSGRNHQGRVRDSQRLLRPDNR